MKSLTKCGCKKLRRTKVSKTIRIANQSVDIQDAPARICDDCGEIHFEGRFLLDLEKKLERLEKQAA